LSRSVIQCGVCVLAIWAAGCADRGLGLDDPWAYQKPTVAVMAFENEAGFPLEWNLGTGMSEILVDRLLATGRFHVIEHEAAAELVKELQLQSAGATRAQRRARLGRFKNVEYFIRGTVTDFDHVSSGRTNLGVGGLGLFGSRSEAVIVLAIQVIDVESREILCSRRIEKTVGTNDSAVKGVYGDVSFGGRAFYQTPLGEVTAEAMQEAVRTIARSVASRRWHPRIAAVEDDGSIAINGGADRRIQPGREYFVLTAGKEIVDPETGDVLGRTEGGRIARLRVTKVYPRYARAELVQGDLAAVTAGLRCRPVPAGR
jgi:curli biogenesis system outer membrane secretion channel CsgG